MGVPRLLLRIERRSVDVPPAQGYVPWRCDPALWPERPPSTGAGGELGLLRHPKVQRDLAGQLQLTRLIKVQERQASSRIQGEVSKRIKETIARVVGNQQRALANSNEARIAAAVEAPFRH